MIKFIQFEGVNHNYERMMEGMSPFEDGEWFNEDDIPDFIKQECLDLLGKTEFLYDWCNVWVWRVEVLDEDKWNAYVHGILTQDTSRARIVGGIIRRPDGNA